MSCQFCHITQECCGIGVPDGDMLECCNIPVTQYSCSGACQDNVDLTEDETAIRNILLKNKMNDGGI